MKSVIAQILSLESKTNGQKMLGIYEIIFILNCAATEALQIDPLASE